MKENKALETHIDFVGMLSEIKDRLSIYEEEKDRILPLSSEEEERLFFGDKILSLEKKSDYISAC